LAQKQCDWLNCDFMGKIAVFDLAIAEFILQGDHVAGEKLPLR